jgi:RNA polymerase sigma factor (sigma-70 family)
LKAKRPKHSPSQKSGPNPWDESQWEAWRQLMVKIQGGDSEAYRQFLNEVGPILLNYVRNRVFNSQLVEDVYQHVLLKLHKARHSYNPGKPLGPWFFTVAHNSVIDYWRRNRKYAENETAVEFLPETAGTDEKEETMEDPLYLALETLPEKNRSAVELLKLKGLSHEEAAKQLGIAPGALRVRAHRGYEQLRKQLLGRKK